jgi:hypothetical protein
VLSPETFLSSLSPQSVDADDDGDSNDDDVVDSNDDDDDGCVNATKSN